MDRHQGKRVPGQREIAAENIHQPNTASAKRLFGLASTLIIPAAVLVFAVYYFVTVRDLLPDSRYYPQAVAVVLVVLTVVIIATEIRHWLTGGGEDGKDGVVQGADKASNIPPLERWTKIGSCVALTTLYIPGILALGFITATGLYVFAVTVALRRRGVLIALALAAFVAGGSYLLLSQLAGMRLPSGLLI